MAILFIDGSGDTKVRWKKSADETMRNVIERMMSEGYSFFLDDQAAPVDQRVERIEDLSNRSIVVMDKTLHALLQQQEVEVVASAWKGAASFVRRLTNAAEVVELAATPCEPSQTEQTIVAVVPKCGG